MRHRKWAYRKRQIILEKMILKDAARKKHEELTATLHRLNNLPPPPDGGGRQWLDWLAYGIGLFIIAALVALSVCGWCW